MHINRLVLVGQVSSGPAYADGYAVFGLTVDRHVFAVYVFDKVIIRETLDGLSEGVTVQVDGRLAFDQSAGVGMYVAVTSDRPCDVRVVTDPARDDARPGLLSLADAVSRSRGTAPGVVAPVPARTATGSPEPRATSAAQPSPVPTAATATATSSGPRTMTASPAPSAPVAGPSGARDDDATLGSDAPPPSPRPAATNGAAAHGRPADAPAPEPPAPPAAAPPTTGRPMIGRPTGRPLGRPLVASAGPTGGAARPAARGGLSALKADEEEVSVDDIPF